LLLSNRPAYRVFAALVLLLGVLAQFAPFPVLAADFSMVFVRLDRMQVSTATGGTVCARPTTASTEGKVLITFPSTYTVNSTATNWDTDVTVTSHWPDDPDGGGPIDVVAWPGIGAEATNVTGQVVTFASTDLTVGDIYCFNWVTTNTLTTAAVAANDQAGSVETQTSGNAQIDRSSYSLSNIADDTIMVTAIVPPIFRFALSPNPSNVTDAFTTTLSDATVASTSGTTVTITTNAKGGWIAWAKDSEQGLYSSSANYDIDTTSNGAPGTPSTLTAGTEGYVMDVNATQVGTAYCTPAPAAEYNGVAADSGGELFANFEQIGYCTGGVSDGDTLTLIERAAISIVTPAATDYSDLITVVGAGSF
jgi:hypothetical protein